MVSVDRQRETPGADVGTAAATWVDESSTDARRSGVAGTEGPRGPAEPGGPGGPAGPGGPGGPGGAGGARRAFTLPKDYNPLNPSSVPERMRERSKQRLDTLTALLKSKAA
jgi:hypothetical protein